MLKISELRQHKQALETDIAKLIQQFESQTHVKVDGLISVSHVQEDDVNEGHNDVKVIIHLDV